MSEKLKLAIRLSAETKQAVRAFVDLKEKSRDTGRALEKTQEELKALNGLIKATGGQDPRLAKQFEAARNRARQLKTAWQGQQVALEQSRRSLSAMGISTANLSASVRRVSRAWVEAQARLHRAAKQGQAKDILGLKPDQNKREIQRTIAALNRLKRAGRASMADIARATDAARKRIKNLQMATDQAAKSQSILGRHLKYVATALGGMGVMRSARGIYRLADAHVELNNRLRLVTHSEGNLAETRRRLYEISQITRTQIGANVALYSKFAMATQKTGHSQADLLKVACSRFAHNTIRVIRGLTKARPHQLAIPRPSRYLACHASRNRHLRHP